jgi:translocation and assembly module TamA
MGRFASVRIDPDLGGGGTIVPVQIGVTQGPRHEVRLGGGFGISPSAYEVRGRSSYRVAGWPTSLTSTFLEFRPAYVWLRDDDSAQPRIEARAVLERMDLFRPFLMAEAEVAFSYLAVEAYTSVGPRVRLGLRSPLWRRIVGASVAWQYELLGFSRIDEALDDATADALGIDGPYHLGYYAQSLYVDLRDDPVAPRLGLYAEARVEEGTVAAGGEFGYLRWTPELRGYAPLGPIVLAARGRLGDFVDDVPVTQRYFAGGASSQRGFAERTLAPTATREVDGETFSAPIGGGAMLETGAELRFPIATIKDIPLGGVVFADGADVTEELDDLDPGHLHWAAGAGLRAATPIGPVRIDLGWRLNRTGDGEPRAGERFAFHLSLGEAF